MADVQYALSIKQPWAALLATGHKTIEVRRWITQLRGRILIHAARIPDERAGVGDDLPDDARELVKQVGGIIGSGELTGCIRYTSAEQFALDRKLHWNDPAWFQPPCLYGFVFTRLKIEPFRRLRGQTRFFTVDEETSAD
jgi:hypothetical protein